MPRGSAQADAAPPMNPPGGDVSPEGGTEVQMVAEQVVMDFRQSTDDSAHVTAWFLFHNTGDVDEHLKVRFPLNGDEIKYLNPSTGEFETYMPLIQDFTARIGNYPLRTVSISSDNPNASYFFLGNSHVLMDWSEFDMDFPKGKDVKLSVSYTIDPTRDSFVGWVDYVLATGAGWKGAINSVDIIYRFPYSISEIASYGMAYYYSIDTFHGNQTMLEENDIRMHWDNLEPTNEDNQSFGFMLPSLWKNVLHWRSVVISSPDNAAAWAALARAYASAYEIHRMFYNPITAEQYINACERSLSLDPTNVAEHAEFAETMTNAGMAEESTYYRDLILNEVAKALKLDPQNKTALLVLDILNSEGISQAELPTPGFFPTRSQTTPTLEMEPTFTLSITPAPTWTPIPTMTVTQSPTKTTNTSPEPVATQEGIEAKPPANAGGMMAFSGTLLIIAGWVTWKSVRGKKN